MIVTQPAPHRLLRVLMTADTVGGVWRYAVDLCTALPEVRFVLATMGPPADKAQRGEVERLENTILADGGYRLEWMAEGYADFEASRGWLIGLIERYDIDLIHVNGYAHADLGVDRPVLVVTHSDVLSWWESVHKTAPPRQWDKYRDRVITGLAAASRIVAPTDAVLRGLEKHYLRVTDKAEVIPNGTDVAVFAPLPKRPVVVAAGRLWDAAKNLAALEAVAPELGWPVEIAGDLEHPQGGIASFTNLRLLGRINRAEMAGHLGRASIFAAPAFYEPFGLAILEAAASGCALVLGDIPSLRENWDVAAVFVGPDDPPALRAAIQHLIANTAERVRLGMLAQCRSRDFTLARMARAYGALYRNAARAPVRLETA